MYSQAYAASNCDRVHGISTLHSVQRGKTGRGSLTQQLHSVTRPLAPLVENAAQFCNSVNRPSLGGRNQLCMPCQEAGGIRRACLTCRSLCKLLPTERTAGQLSGRMAQQMPQHGLEPHVVTVAGCSELTPVPCRWSGLSRMGWMSEASCTGR